MKRQIGILILVFLVATMGSVFAANNESAANATVTISSGGKVITVQATAARAYLKWFDFNVAAGETVYFKFMNGSDTILNYVGSASTVNGTVGGKIAGTTTTGGNLIFWSPNGFSVGSTGYITAGSTTINTSKDANAEAWLLGDKLAFSGSKANISIAGAVKGIDAVVLDGKNVDLQAGSVIGVDTAVPGVKLASAKITGDELVTLGGTVTANAIDVTGGSIYITGKVRAGNLALTATQDKIIETSTGSIYTNGLFEITDLTCNSRGIGTIVLASANNVFAADPATGLSSIRVNWNGNSFQEILIQDPNVTFAQNIKYAKPGYSLTWPLNPNAVRWSDSSVNALTLR